MTMNGDTFEIEVMTIESEGTQPQHYVPAVFVRTSDGLFQILPCRPDVTITQLVEYAGRMAHWETLWSLGSTPKFPPPPPGRPKSPPPDRPNKKTRISSTRKDSGGSRPKAGIKETDAVDVTSQISTSQDSGGSRPSGRIEEADPVEVDVTSSTLKDIINGES